MIPVIGWHLHNPKGALGRKKVRTLRLLITRLPGVLDVDILPRPSNSLPILNRGRWVE